MTGKISSQHVLGGSFNDSNFASYQSGASYPDWEVYSNLTSYYPDWEVYSNLASYYPDWEVYSNLTSYYPD